MAAPLKTKHRPVTGFDVTCTIGRVELDPDALDSPHVSAFKLIAEHDAPGVYRFPMPNGDVCVVGVEYERGDVL